MDCVETENNDRNSQEWEESQEKRFHVEILFWGLSIGFMAETG